VARLIFKIVFGIQEQERVSIMKPVLLEIVAPMISGVEMSCRGCKDVFNTLGLTDKDRKACAQTYPEDWKFAVDSLSKWVDEISRLYRHRIRIRIIDAQSPMGLWKQLRHRVFKFPAFIINNKKKYVGWDYKELEALIDEDIRKGRLPSG